MLLNLRRRFISCTSAVVHLFGIKFPLIHTVKLMQRH